MAVSQQFQQNRFGKRSGARVVRITCHPDYANVSWFEMRFWLLLSRWITALQALNSFILGITLVFSLKSETGNLSGEKTAR